MAKYRSIPGAEHPSGQSPAAHRAAERWATPPESDDVQEVVFDEIVRILQTIPGLRAEWMPNEQAREPPHLPYAWVVRGATTAFNFTSTDECRRVDYTVRVTVRAEDVDAAGRYVLALDHLAMDRLSNVSLLGVTAPGWTQIGRVAAPPAAGSEAAATSVYSGYFVYPYERP